MINNTRHLDIKNKIILAGIGMAVLWWFFETMMDVIVFQEGLFIELVFPADPNELWMRLVTVCLFVGFSMYVGLAMSRLMKMSERLRASNQQLIASEQQLKAANQQLSASNQQLDASNQQQLKATNQQLNASNQQLRAANQQLIASEQQFKAANQQLRASEEALRDSEERFRDFFENAAIGFHIFGPDRIITNINEAELAMIGYDRDEIVGKKMWADLIIPEQKDQFEKHWCDIITKGKVRDLEYTLIHKDGHHIDVILNASSRFDKDGNIINTRGSVLNITNRKQVEKALHENEEKFRSFTENAPSFIVQLDRKGTILFVNRTYEFISKDEVQGTSLFKWLPEDEEVRTSAHRILAKVFDSLEPQSVEFPAVMPNGETHWYSVNIGPIKSEDKATSAILICDDITKRKQAEESLLKAHGELEQRVQERTAQLTDANKKLNKEIGERKGIEKEITNYQKRLQSLTSELSKTEEHTKKYIAETLHDDAIQTLIFLKMKFDDLRKHRSSPEFIKSLNRINKETDDLIQRLRTMTFDLSSPILYELGLAAAIKNWLTQEIQKKYNISTKFEDDGKIEPLDEDLRILLYRAVRELLANVVKHAEAKSVTVSRKKQGKNIVITVKDDGKGFADPEKVLKSNTLGGFGLFSISERLSQCNGSLEIKNDLGGGTRVVLTAPLSTIKSDDIGEG